MALLWPTTASACLGERAPLTRRPVSTPDPPPRLLCGTLPGLQRRSLFQRAAQRSTLGQTRASGWLRLVTELPDAQREKPQCQPAPRTASQTPSVRTCDRSPANLSQVAGTWCISSFAATRPSHPLTSALAAERPPTRRQERGGCSPKQLLTNAEGR